jgi:putative tricarboxylic transport membrane protein
MAKLYTSSFFICQFIIDIKIQLELYLLPGLRKEEGQNSNGRNIESPCGNVPEGDGARISRTMQKWNKIAGGILFCVGAVTAWSAATTLSMGSLRHPGPGFLPFGLAVILSLLSLCLVFGTEKGKGPAPAFWPQRTWIRPVQGSLALFAYAFFLSILGFVPTTFLFLVGWTRFMEKLSWLKVLWVAAGVTAALYLVFVWFLGVPVPVGFGKR